MEVERQDAEKLHADAREQTQRQLAALQSEVAERDQRLSQVTAQAQAQLRDLDNQVRRLEPVTVRPPRRARAAG